MRRFVKLFCLILAVQMGCVAFGLWVYYRYVVSVAIESSKNVAWEELAEVGDNFFAGPGLPKRHIEPGLNKPGLNNSRANHSVIDRIRVQTKSADLPDWLRIIVVDSEWKILFQHSGKNHKSATERASGEIVSWQEQKRSTNESDQFKRGTLKLDEKPFLGLAYRLVDTEIGSENHEADSQTAHLIILRSMNSLRVSPTEIFRSLPMVSVVTFFSICGLLSLSMFLLLKRIYDEFSKEKKPSLFGRPDSRSRLLFALVTELFSGWRNSRNRETTTPAGTWSECHFIVCGWLRNCKIIRAFKA